MDKTFLSVQLDRELKRRLAIAAAKAGVSRSEVVRRAIQEYLEELEGDLELLEQAANTVTGFVTIDELIADYEAETT